VWRYVLAQLVLVALIIALLWFEWLPAAGGAAALVVATVATAISMLRWRWLWRFIRLARHFRETSVGQIRLYYATELEGDLYLPVLCERWEAELDRLSQRFTFPLPRPVTIFLFARHEDISHIFGPQYGGTALSAANAIVIAVSNGMQEAVRHELAHLFSLCWNTAAPPLLSEGLSVWLQETQYGQPIDIAVRPLLADSSLRLTQLLTPAFFFSDRHRRSCYLLAGSFTGFLIKQYGWDRYRNLFRMCNGNRFQTKFMKCFGVSLESAESQWRARV